MGKNHKIYYAGKPIGSVTVLAKTLDLSETVLKKVAANPENYYTQFVKRVKNKDRSLAEANSDLKILQKRIISRIFSNIQFPHYLHGGIKSDPPKDFISNAGAHAKAEVALTLDIRNFYPSINFSQVQDTFRLLLKFPPDVSDLLAKIVTLNGQVPQGAATSSYIANLVMYAKEYKLAAKLEGQGLVYTRLIDDITVSSTVTLSKEKLEKLISEVIAMLRSYNYEAHPKKTQIYNRKNPKKLMVVTGLWLNRRTPRVKSEQRDQISFEVLQVKKCGEQNDVRCLESYHKDYNKASGRVALLQRLQHTEASRLRSVLEPIKPIYDEQNIAKIKKLVTNFSRREQDQTKLGYIKRFYLLQNSVAIVKRTHPRLAKSLQQILNKKRPHTHLSDIYG